MKKSVAVIALDPFSGKAYARQVQSVFGDRVQVRNYSVMDGTVANMETLTSVRWILLRCQSS